MSGLGEHGADGHLVVRAERRLPSYAVIRYPAGLAAVLALLLVPGAALAWNDFWPIGMFFIFGAVHFASCHVLFITEASLSDGELTLVNWRGPVRTYDARTARFATTSPLRVAFAGGVPVYAGRRLVGVMYLTISAQDLVPLRSGLDALRRAVPPNH